MRSLLNKTIAGAGALMLVAVFAFPSVADANTGTGY